MQYKKGLLQTNLGIQNQKDIHDITITQLKYPNSVEGHIFLSWIHPFKSTELL